MFLLILVMTSIYGSRGMSYFRSHPTDTFAVAGQTVALSCTLQNVQCAGKESHYNLNWGLKMTRTTTSVQYLSKGTEVLNNLAGSERYTVSQQGCKWSLHIGNPNDGRYYYCHIYIKNNKEFESSDVARLTVVDPIGTTVKPSRIERYDVGQNATFRCLTRPMVKYQLKYIWYTKQKNRNQVVSWQQLMEDNSVAFRDNNKTMTMLSFTMRDNGTAVKCMVFRGSMSITGETISGLLLVHRNEVTMETYTGEISTSQMTINPSVLLNGSLNQQSTPSPLQTFSFLPTKKQDPDSDCINAFSESTNSTVVVVGWPLAAVFICLFIASLLYIIMTKRRSKDNPNSTRVVQTTQNEDAEAYQEMETELHGQAYTGHTETAPSSYQELIFK